jgi:hypothetical protein
VDAHCITSPEPKVHLDDVIERIERMNLDENSTPYQSVEQTGPTRTISERSTKWLIKKLESVHPYEVGKTRTIHLTRQHGANVDNLDSGDVDDMNVSYDYELNLSTNFEPTSFEEATSHDELEEAMHKEYDSLIKNAIWKLVDPPFRIKSIGYKRFFKNK